MRVLNFSTSDTAVPDGGDFSKTFAHMSQTADELMNKRLHSSSCPEERNIHPMFPVLGEWHLQLGKGGKRNGASPFGWLINITSNTVVDMGRVHLSWDRLLLKDRNSLYRRAAG